VIAEVRAPAPQQPYPWRIRSGAAPIDSGTAAPSMVGFIEVARAAQHHIFAWMRKGRPAPARAPAPAWRVHSSARHLVLEYVAIAA